MTGQLTFDKDRLYSCSCNLVFSFQIYNKVKTGDQLKVEHVVSVLEKQYPYVEVSSILGIDSAYDQNRKVRIHEIKLFFFPTSFAATVLKM